ncbi:MAG: ABC transporter permease [Dermatophilaceae bacterium]
MSLPSSAAPAGDGAAGGQDVGGLGTPRFAGVGVRVGLGAVSALTGIALWQFGSLLLPGVLPGPIAAFGGVAATFADGTLVPDLAVTFARMVAAFLPVLLVSVIAGLLLGTSRVAEALFGGWVTIAGSVPALVVVVTTYLALGITEVGAVIAVFLSVLPSMTRQVTDGVRAGDTQLREMARAFGASRRTVTWRVRLPELVPCIVTTAKVGWSLTWRLIILVELVGRSSGIGYRIEYWFTLTDMRRVLGTALPFLVLMLGAEALVLRPLERWTRRRRAVELR